ncbi:methyltransferase [Catenuloplanes indicus]|uniref:SAM-dependent methyltransferase n=1 Tax=Catenuloplanes indicus TaxID=137267 RepID=A0AAE3W4G8_9ACTN|nr:methyltransferase [Catenuloplanes indicus]MDQ0369411.1 SAM-dependent methyltransferase [Catenuloplanes indicus]
MDVVTAERIIRVGRGFALAKALFVASEAGLFEAVGAGATLERIAERVGMPERSVRRICQLLADGGLLAHEDGRYRNAPDAEAFLSGRGPADLRPMLRFWDVVSYPGWTEAERAYRTGEGVYPPLSPMQVEAYESGVAVVTAAAAGALATSYDFGAHKRVLDVGGGLGTFLLPILARAPHLTGVLVDLPEVAELAARRLAGEPRIEVAGADVLTDPLPAGCDVIVVANVLHLLTPERCVALLGRLREVAEPGGRLLLVDWWRDPVEPHPDSVSGASEFLMFSGGDTYEASEAADWLTGTGWRPLEVREVLPPTGVLIAEPVM